MARHFFYPPILGNPNDTVYGGSVLPTYRKAPTDLRNLFRSGDGLGYASMNVALNGTRYKVSDIVTYVSGIYERMYAFLLRDTLLDLEYMFLYAGKSSTSGTYGTKATLSQMIGSGQTLATAKLQQATSNTNVNYGQNHTVEVATFLNIDPSTSSWGRNWGFDNPTEMTFSGGDYKDIAALCDPTTTWTTHWLPSGVDNPNGVYWHDSAGSFDNYSLTSCYVLDSTNGALAVFFEVGTGGTTGWWMHSPTMFNPITPGDTYTQGTTWGWRSPSSAAAAGGYGSNGFASTGFDDVGNAETFLSYPQNTFTLENEKKGGVYRWRSVPIASSTFDKGWLNSDLIAEISGYQRLQNYNQRFAHPSASEPMCKYQPNVAVMWAPNVPSFPFWYSGLT